MDCLELIKKVADNKVDFVLSCGHAKAGCNGPYNNQDTPVRNSAHWLITYSFLYRRSGEKKYYNAAKKLADYLIQEKNYGNSGSICCRKDIRFNHTNGLIGQAWTIEGLIEAARLFHNRKYYDKAKGIFEAQKFNYENNLWEITDCDGTKDFDLTYNHQLWFAASGAIILQYEIEEGIEKSEHIDTEIILFLDASLQSYFTVYKNGLIVHTVDYKLTEDECAYRRELDHKRKCDNFKKNPIKVISKKIQDKTSKFDFSEGLEEGYHIFDLYGFAILKESYDCHEIFKCGKLMDAINYALNTDALIELRNSCGGESFNKFAFGYNSPAFEYPYVSLVFSGNVDEKIESELLSFQMDNTFENGTFRRNCIDPETMDARIYELVRFLRLYGDINIPVNDKRKVCFLTNSIADIGGRQRINAIVANEMAKSPNINISILFTASKSVAEKHAYELSAKVRTLWDKNIFRGRKDIFYKLVRGINKKVYKFHRVNFLRDMYFPKSEVAAYNRFFSENRFDIVIGVGTRPSGMLSLLTDKSKKIGWFHTSYDLCFMKKDYFQWRQERLYHKLLSQLDAIVVLTDRDAIKYKESFPCNPVRIYNPLTLSSNAKSTGKGNQFLFVGRLDYELKGLDLLVQAMEIVKKEINDFTVTVVGDGDGKEKLIASIKEVGLEDYFILVGAQNDVVPYYLNGTMLLLTSRQEGFGLVVTEAMECGLPVISFKTEGPSEIIEDGINGFLIDNYDVYKFAEKIIFLCKDNIQREKISKNAINRAKDFSCDSILEQWEMLMSKVLE